MLVIAAWLGFCQGGLTLAEAVTRSPIAVVNWALLGLDFDYERSAIQPTARIDAGRETRAYRPQRIIIVEASRDTFIPKSGREALWHAMGEPRRVIRPINQDVGFLTVTPLGGNIMARRIFDLLDQAL